jgi:hypothetical protein
MGPLEWVIGGRLVGDVGGGHVLSAHALRALIGERESGDAAVIQPFPGGLLVAAIDGLGHGAEAAEPARRAAGVLRADAGRAPDELIVRCHHALARTRGAVMTVASIDLRAGRMTWVGVGNVEGRLLRASAEAGAGRESVLLMGGVVGYQLPALRPSTVMLEHGDLVILATDGISGGFEQDIATGSVDLIADAILGRYGKESDDALVVVGRYIEE